MERYICIHGHFYQPPRENAWLESVEQQDSAYPYHDWNERITAECYAPNAVARMLDGEGRITRIVNNYARISFNFGPTLLSWLEEKSPEVYEAILQADRDSRERFGGHGSAMAQAYNHIIMPLADRRDKETQVVWGIRDFERRFGRSPEGMWLAETAVDVETLEVLAEHGIKFTVLAPYQAGRVRRIDNGDWQDVVGGRVDPTTVYRQNLPSGRSIALFFYDGPISRAVAFEKLLAKGELLADRLLGAFTDDRPWPQVVHIATDGESYGHHFPHGDMALAYALHHIEENTPVRLINYGEYLEKHPPVMEAEIVENTAWSCAHGIDRWRADCGCNSGRAGWNQAWRGPLRTAFDTLRDAVRAPFEKRGTELLRDPWAARNAYLTVIQDRSTETVDRFLAEQAARPLEADEQTEVLKLMELQRACLLMYTSCGWFFDEVSGIETVQVIQYGGRAVQLAEELFGVGYEAMLLDQLEKAKSNLPEHQDGRKIYLKWVKPAMVGWNQIAAHYAVSSLFESYPSEVRLFCYLCRVEDFHAEEAGMAKLVCGRAQVSSEITRETRELTYGVLHFGDHNVNGGVRDFQGEEPFRQLAGELTEAFRRADFPAVIRLFDRGFGESTYSLKSLFRDEQRKVMRQLLAPVRAEAEAVYRRLYQQQVPTMRFLLDLGVPLPRAFRAASEFLINHDIGWLLKDDEPDVTQLRTLLHDAKEWGVTLDTPWISYCLKTAVSRLADRLRLQPDNLPLLEALTGLVVLVHELPFDVDLWQPQNFYYHMMLESFPDFLEKAAAGEDPAREWCNHFIELGNRLGVQVGEIKKKVTEIRRLPGAEELVAEAFGRRRTPTATYRLQFTKDFRFADALRIVPYLHRLGVSDVYASPILQARPGSTHGYDVSDHSRLNAELGTDEEFDALAAALRERGMGMILDVVPNHMGVGSTNPWWMDVLENGPSSAYASHFDIDWNPVNPNLKNKVLLPILEDQYGKVLEAGKIRLAYEDGAFALYYYEHRLPVEPRSGSRILEVALEQCVDALGEDDEYVQELRSVLTALSYLPPTDEADPDRVGERQREKEVIKKRVAALTASSPEVAAAVEAAVQAFNGTPDDPHSFDLLHGLVEVQPYRPAYWRVATEEINYRRFFDINELAAVRIELPEVLQATHRLIFRLLAEGKAHGLRVDHPDGLWDPSLYFRQLQESFVASYARTRMPADRITDELLHEVNGLLMERAQEYRPPLWPLYVVAEKILSESEPLPREWAVDGTTGYDFLNLVNGLFVDGRHREDFDRIYGQFVGTRRGFPTLVESTKKMIMLVSMVSEINALSHQLDRITERNRRYRDFTLNSLTFAVREIIANLPVYRSYTTGPDDVSLRDRMVIESAVEEAKQRNPRTAESIFDFIRDTLLLHNLENFAEADRQLLLEWVMKFQQISGPVMAKGLEDTSFYIYNRLVSLNEVGGHPDTFGVEPETFHRANTERNSNWPHALLTTSTHDTKRGEDVRARVNVLSEIPVEWEAALERWRSLNAGKKSVVDDRPAPDANDEYLLYQTLVGAWPVGALDAAAFADFRDRIYQYMTKATREAKVHTSWINPNEEYDAAIRDFVYKTLSDDPQDPFRKDVEAFHRRVAFFGTYNALAQTVLRLTCPGVPDVYQGTELWDLSLVDPDNRRPVDFDYRLRLLDRLKASDDGKPRDLLTTTLPLLSAPDDGRVKLFMLNRTLHFRRSHSKLFAEGTYEPLEAVGEAADHVLAFARRTEEDTLVVVVPRLIVGLTGGVERPPIGCEVWKGTRVYLPGVEPGEQFRHLYTGEEIPVEMAATGGGLALARVFGNFPVAVLVRQSS